MSETTLVCCDAAGNSQPASTPMIIEMMIHWVKETRRNKRSIAEFNAIAAEAEWRQPLRQC